MSRIGSFGATQMYLSRMLAIQGRVNVEQTQVATELKSVNYTGVAGDSNRIINLENERARAQQYIKSNNAAETRLEAANVSMTAMEKTMKDFKGHLDSFAQSITKNQDDIEQLQKWAFTAMQDMQSYLSANVDGQYIFSGGRVSTEPVRLPASSLEDFQQMFDGNDIRFPTTRAAHMADFTTSTAVTGNLTFDAVNGTISGAPGTLSDIPEGGRVTVAGASAGNNQSYTVVSNDGTTIKVSRLTSDGPGAPGMTIGFNGGASSLTDVDTGGLHFVPGTDTISAANPLSLAGLGVGTVFTISGSGAGNDGTYEVAANDGTNITIRSTKIGVGETVAATLSTTSWYEGDNLAIEHQVDADRSLDLGVYASDPSFEKAFRAMGLIAQGAYGTAGGLENNLDRINQARFLMQDAISRNTSGVGPNGVTEDVGDIEALQTKVGTTHNQLSAKNAKHKAYIGFLETRLQDMQRVDKTEAVARLLDDQQALEVSYKTMASVRSLSLLNYMK